MLDLPISTPQVATSRALHMLAGRTQYSPRGKFHQEHNDPQLFSDHFFGKDSRHEASERVILTATPTLVIIQTSIEIILPTAYSASKRSTVLCSLGRKSSYVPQCDGGTSGVVVSVPYPISFLLVSDITYRCHHLSRSAHTDRSNQRARSVCKDERQ